MQEDVEHASGWHDVLEASLCALEGLLTSSKHGLCSDFMAYDPLSKRYHAVTTQVLERPSDGTFSWNACRCAPALCAGFRFWCRYRVSRVRRGWERAPARP